MTFITLFGNIYNILLSWTGIRTLMLASNTIITFGATLETERP